MRIAKIMLIALALVAPAFAKDAPPPVARAQAAAQVLQRYVDRIDASGGLPDYTRAPAADLFRQVFDLDALTALPAPQAGDLGWMIEWSSTASQVSKMLLFHGMKPGAQPDVAAAERNMDLYEDQYAAAGNFLIRLSAREATAMERFFAGLAPEQRTPVRAAGLARAKGGGAEIIAGMLTVTAGATKPANARLISAALRDTGDVWAGYITSEARARLLDLAARVRQRTKDEEVHRNLASFSSALQAAK